ncbi:MAG: hypothetical protein E6J88_03235 [Deltaproteobacteria bacterium]|nr:MAG: hypothetical protein E6J88_03235 [Deltaproteobacteria bacterium]
MRVLPLLLALACGGGPQLSNLRCRDPAHCQDVEDPLKVLLAVDFVDDTATLDKGVLNLRVNGGTQQTVSLSDMFAAQGIATGTKKGTLQIDDDMTLDKMSQGQQVQVSLVAVNGQGHSSNEPSLTFTLHLGGP